MKLNKILPFFLIAAILVVLPITLYVTRQTTENRQRAAAATTISLTPQNATVAPGQQFNVTATINTGDLSQGGNLVSGAELHLQYDQSKFQYVSAALSASPFLPTLDVVDSTSTPGQIEINLLSNPNLALATPPTGTQTGNLVNITFKALQTTSAVPFTFTSQTQVSAIGADLGKNVLNGTTGAAIAVINPSPTPVATPTPTPSPTIVPTPTPAPTPTPSASPPAIPVLAPPVVGCGLTVSVGLSWSQVVTATEYRVERCSGSALCTTFAQIAATQTNSYTDTPLISGTTYRYRVRAFNLTTQLFSNYSNIVTVTPICITPSPTPMPTPIPTATPVPTATPLPTPDTTLPTTSITSPLSGAVVSGTTLISATAADNVGVTQVEFYVDGVIKSTDTAFPYSFSWDTTNGGTHPCIGPHTHSLTTRAYDASGNVGTSSAVVVNMNNPPYCASPSPSPSPVNNPPTITTMTLPPGQEGAFYSSRISGSDLDPADTLTMTIIGLPGGVTKNSACAIGGPASGGPITIDCDITGVPNPQTAGTYQVSATLTDNHGGSDAKVIPFVITPQSSPTPTPSLSPTPSPVINSISVKFEGIVDSRPDQKLVNFTFVPVGGSQITIPGVVMTADTNGIFSNQTAFSNPLLTAGTYDIYVTGPVHLTTVFTGKSVNPGPNTIDLTASVLKTADIVHDNVIDIKDYNGFITSFGCTKDAQGVVTTPPGKVCTSFSADLDLSNRIDINDYAYLVSNYQQQGIVIP